MSESTLPKQRLSVVISADVVERARDAVYWSVDLTLASLTADALTVALDKLERKNGGEFEPRQMELKAGRPAK